MATTLGVIRTDFDRAVGQEPSVGKKPRGWLSKAFKAAGSVALGAASAMGVKTAVAVCGVAAFGMPVAAAAVTASAVTGLTMGTFAAYRQYQKEKHEFSARPRKFWSVKTLKTVATHTVLSVAGGALVNAFGQDLADGLCKLFSGAADVQPPAVVAPVPDAAAAPAPPADVPGDAPAVQPETLPPVEPEAPPAPAAVSSPPAAAAPSVAPSAGHPSLVAASGTGGGVTAAQPVAASPVSKAVFLLSQYTEIPEETIDPFGMDEISVAPVEMDAPISVAGADAVQTDAPSAAAGGQDRASCVAQIGGPNILITCNVSQETASLLQVGDEVIFNPPASAVPPGP